LIELHQLAMFWRQYEFINMHKQLYIQSVLTLDFPYLKLSQVEQLVYVLYSCVQ
jgi:hypothetical protein